MWYEDRDICGWDEGVVWEVVILCIWISARISLKSICMDVEFLDLFNKWYGIFNE